MTKGILTAETRRCGDLSKPLVRSLAFGSLFLSICFGMAAGTYAQPETPPEPGKARVVSIPAVKETTLKNGLTVATIQRSSVPLVTVQLLVNTGASTEEASKAGLANMTADMLTKGTKTRTATQIAEQIAFLGGSINTGAGWDNSNVSVTVTSDKLEAAMAILADVVLNPAFKTEELDLLRSQALDELKFNLRQPGFLTNYVASKYSFGEHPATGTPASIESITTADVTAYHQKAFRPENAVLIFAGDITPAKAESLSSRAFGKWQSAAREKNAEVLIKLPVNTKKPTEQKAEIERLLVVDLPNSGQASVSYLVLSSAGRADGTTPNPESSSSEYFSASVLNSLLGGGYSSRLNQEIRIKRGLSYGAGSSFAWRWSSSNFSTRTQTKNESAPEVAELVLAEVKRLADGEIADAELNPRKSVLTGGFGRNLETTAGLAAAAADLYSFGIPTSEMNSYMTKVNAVTDEQIRDFAKSNLLGGDIIIVGDYSVFKDDLAKRFPDVKVTVIKADDLDITKAGLVK